MRLETYLCRESKHTVCARHITPAPPHAASLYFQVWYIMRKCFVQSFIFIIFIYQQYCKSTVDFTFLTVLQHSTSIPLLVVYQYYATRYTTSIVVVLCTCVQYCTSTACFTSLGCCFQFIWTHITTQAKRHKTKYLTQKLLQILTKKLCMTYSSYWTSSVIFFFFFARKNSSKGRVRKGVQDGIVRI